MSWPCRARWRFRVLSSLLSVKRDQDRPECVLAEFNREVGCDYALEAPPKVNAHVNGQRAFVEAERPWPTGRSSFQPPSAGKSPPSAAWRLGALSRP